MSGGLVLGLSLERRKRGVRKAAQNNGIDYCVTSGSLGGERHVMSSDYWFSVQEGPIAYLFCVFDSQQFIEGRPNAMTSKK